LSKFFEVNIPVTINESGISLEAYCWGSEIVPYSEKIVFGEAEYETFEVYGRITATKRSEPTLGINEVEFSVEKSDNFDGHKYGINALPAASFKMDYENINAYHHMFQYVKATVIKDKYGNYTLTSTLFSLDGLDEYSSSFYVRNSFDGTRLEFYTDIDSQDTKIYQLDDTLTGMYINGVPVGSVNIETVNSYILNNDCGRVLLIDANNNGKINYILVDYYVDAVVDSIYESKTCRIYFSNKHHDVKNLTMDTTNENISAIYKLNGHEISYKDLQKGDVLSIAYDVTNSFENSLFYDVMVSRKTVSGNVSYISDFRGTEYFVINGMSYSAAISMYGYVNAEKLDLKTEYILYLNAFGKFVSYDATKKLIGIFDEASIDSSYTPKIRIITSDGIVSYPVKYNSILKYNELAKVGYNVTQGNTSKGVYASISDKKSLESRIVEYTVDSSGSITNISSCNDIQTASGEHNATHNQIDNIPFSYDTVVIDISNGNNSDFSIIKYVSVLTTDDFSNNAIYQVYAAGKSNSDGTYRFVVVTNVEFIYNGNASIAVYKSRGIEYFDDDAVEIITAYTNGAGENDDETTRLLIAHGYISPSLNAGDVFIYKTNSDGYINEIFPIFTGIKKSGYQDFVANVVNNVTIKTFAGSQASLTGEKKYWDTISTMPQEWVDTDNTSKAGNVEILFGVITNKKYNKVFVADIVNGKVNKDTAPDYVIANDANVYVYNYSERKEANRVSLGSASSLVKSPVLDSDIDDNGYFDIIEDNQYREMNFVFAKLVDGKIEEALAIVI